MSYSSLPKHAEAAQLFDHARQKIAAPAISLMVLAICGALVGIIQAVGVLGTFCVIAADKGLPGSHEALQVYSVFGGGAIAGIAATIVYVLVFFGAVNMKNLRRRPIAIFASILALIPCASPCFLLSLPLGIWALIVLNAEDVKNSFR